MWKYTGVKECNEFLLSLHLISEENHKKYIKTIYGIANNIPNNYRIFKIKKRRGGHRTIYEPKPMLKYIQKQILSSLLNEQRISNYAKAYHKNISLKDNALPHLNKKTILKLDIKNFFNSISFLDVYNACFPLYLYPAPVGIILTYLCTYQGHLVEGAPTSAYISNLVMRDLDEQIGLWCSNKNIVYTRYSDDFTFSGDFNPQEVIEVVKKLLNKKGLKLNNKKTKVINNSQSQNVTGIVVNEKLQVSSKKRKMLRQEIYYIKKYGIKSHLEKRGLKYNSKEYLNILYGKILYVLQINAADKEFNNYKKYLSDLIKKIK